MPRSKGVTKNKYRTYVTILTVTNVENLMDMLLHLYDSSCKLIGKGYYFYCKLNKLQSFLIQILIENHLFN